MGRGRAKAKQAKVARELKYNSGGTDLERLRAELVGGSASKPAGGLDTDLEDDAYDDPYAEDYDDEDDPRSA